MTSSPGESDYPSSTVKPELFSSTGGCNTALPVGEVVEWFDFGQFVELYATDESGTSHPLVVTQDDAVLQASLRIRNETGMPTRTVDLAGGCRSAGQWPVRATMRSRPSASPIR